MTSSVVAAASGGTAVGAVAAEGAPAGLTKGTLPTPALIVDLEALEANVTKMADHCRQAKVGFRPHAKTHKCPAIAQRQMAAGAKGICTATVPEAESMVSAGIRGILLCSPIVDAGKIGRMVALISGGADVILAVGSERQEKLLA
jgi:D-serine deaminase-like pyridoxal phosphate-dependent protein